MRTFRLLRHEDESGISGTGFVAQGVVFDDGSVALRWMVNPPGEDSVRSFYPSIESVERIHGHGGKTQVVWDLPRG